MALELSQQNPQANVIASKPTVDVRALVEKVAAQRKAAAETPAEPATATPAAEPPKPPAPDPETAIALERHKAEVEVMRERLARMDAEIRRRDEADAARKGDWQRALSDYGYKPEDVLPGWIQGEPVKPTAAPAGGPQAELVERLAKLEGVITTAKAESDRERRMREVREAMGAAPDEYSVMDVIGADQGFLDLVLAEEKRRGVPVGQNELVAMLKAHEGKARDVVKPQIEKLARSKWGQELFRALLAQSAVEEKKPEPAAEPEPATRGLITDKPVMRLGRDTAIDMEEAKQRVIAKIRAAQGR